MTENCVIKKDEHGILRYVKCQKQEEVQENVITQLIRSFSILEGLALLMQDSFFKKNNPQKFVEDVYKIAHIAGGRCKNRHDDWIEEVLKIEKGLVEAGYIDPWEDYDKEK